MEKTWLEYLINLLGSLDPILQILLVIFIAPTLFVTFNIVINKSFRDDVFSLLKRPKLDTMYKLNNHEIFISKSTYKQYINNISFNNEIKDRIFKIILRHKVTIVISELKKFINKKGIVDVDIEMTKFIDSVILIYEEKILAELKDKYKKDAKILYKLIYEDSFKYYHSNNITYILKTITLLSNSKLSDNQKLYIFLNGSYVALDLAVLHCEKTFQDLNGDLDSYNEKYYK